jgi:hypothetical protein
MSRASPPAVRCAHADEAHSVAQLLHDFNREFDEPTPPVGDLERRIAQLLRGGDTIILLIGAGPDGLAVLRFRDAIWSSGLECYLAELYVTPARRGPRLQQPQRRQRRTAHVRVRTRPSQLGHQQSLAVCVFEGRLLHPPRLTAGPQRGARHSPAGPARLVQVKR